MILFDCNISPPSDSRIKQVLMCCYHYTISRRLMHYSDAKNPGFPGFFTCKSFTMSFSIFYGLYRLPFHSATLEQIGDFPYLRSVVMSVFYPLEKPPCSCMDKLYSSKGKNGRLLAATSRSFTPAHAYGCAAQYFEVSRGSIIVPPCMSSPTSC